MRHQLVFALSYALTGWFLCVLWLGSKPAALLYPDGARTSASAQPGPGPFSFETIDIFIRDHHPLYLKAIVRCSLFLFHKWDIIIAVLDNKHLFRFVYILTNVFAYLLPPTISQCICYHFSLPWSVTPKYHFELNSPLVGFIIHNMGIWTNNTSACVQFATRERELTPST